jgi:hypothetical protein
VRGRPHVRARAQIVPCENTQEKSSKWKIEARVEEQSHTEVHG